MTRDTEFSRNARDRLQQLEDELELLDARIDEVGAKARVHYKNAVQEARAKGREARDMLDELRDCSDEARQAIADDFEKARADMKGAITRAGQGID